MMSDPELNTPVTEEPIADAGGVSRPSNKTFSALVEDAPFGVYVVDSRLRIWAANRAVRAAIGEDTARPGRDFAEVVRMVWPEPGASRAIERFRHTLETGEPFVAPRLTAPRQDTHRIESYDWQIRRLTLPDGTFGVACYFLDLTASYEAEAALAVAAERDAFLIALNDRLRPLRDPLEIQDEAVRVLGERLGTDWVHYTEFEGDFSYSTVHTNHVRSGAPNVVARHPTGNFGPLIDELRTGRTVAVEDLHMTPLATSDEWMQYTQAGLRAFVGAPIVKDGQLIAAFGVATRVPRVWTPQEIAFIEETAERTWAAVERARAEQAVANELRDTRLLHDLSARLVSEGDTQAFFDAILAAAVAITGASAASMRMYDAATNDLTLLATQGFDAETILRLPRVDAGSTNSTGRAFATGLRAFIDFDDPAAADPDGSLRLHFEAGFRSAQSTPLVTRAGRTIGVLSTYWCEHRRPSERELRFLDLLARQAADLIERRRADQALRESEQTLSDELADTKLLQTLSAQLIEEEDSSTLYEKLVDAANSIMHSEFASLQIYRAEREPAGALRLLASRGFSPEAAQYWEWVSAQATTTCGEALRRGMRVVAPDIEHCLFMAGTADQAMYLQAGVRSGQTTPLVSRAGRTVGMISTYWRRPFEPPERDLRLLDLVARQAADLMERAQAIEALRRSESQLKEADRRKDEFLAVLAHELRNPLAPIRTGLELIRLAGESHDMIEEARAMMERQVGHMVRLIDDLLDVSRIASGKIQLRRQPILLSALVDSAIEATRAALGDANVALDVDLPDVPVLLDVDPTRFVQILSNVLHNAVKFSYPGERVTVRARLDQDAREAQFIIVDSGVGISADLLPRVFELFTQHEASSFGGRPGLGIGLALARQLIELHGGSIEAHSDGAGLGSTFTIRMPLPAETGSVTSPTSPRNPPHMRRRVVVIDDNTDAANAISRLVTIMGGECRVAYDGEAGVAEVLAFHPDIVFVDIGMPGIDGYEVCRRIRRDTGPEVLVVALTGWGQERNKQEAARAGFDLHLTKPADAATLETILATGRPVIDTESMPRTSFSR